MSAELIQNRDELREFLVKDRLANAYLLGNLDPSYFQFCKWYGLRGEKGELESLSLIYTGLSLPVVFMVGPEAHFQEMLQECQSVLPERFHFHVQEDRMQVINGLFEPTMYQKMHRMGLGRSQYKHGNTRVLENIHVERLGHRDTLAIMDLYQHYPDNFFEPYQLETGLYFGVRDEDLGLSSIAGIHVFSEEHDIAVIGNFVTHPDRRGRGLATACTAKLLDALFERISFVALNVQEGNDPALRMYSNFGFEKNNVFYEGRVDI